MTEVESKYCRLCAESKSQDKLLNLEDDEEKFKEIHFKLTFLNAEYVEVADRTNALPKTVCFVCYESLKKAYDFLIKVKQAQDILTLLFSSTESKYDLSDDDRTLDDLISTSADYEANVKEETSEQFQDVSIESPGNQYQLETSVHIKNEPKEETNEMINGSLDQTLDFQKILESVSTNAPFSSKVTLYAKEFDDIGTKDIKSWKDYSWLCCYCNIEFLDVVTLRSHSKVVHGRCAAFSCIDCSKYTKTSDFAIFIKHVRKHRPVLRDYCQYCDSNVDYSEMKLHLKQHFHNAQTACKLCGEIIKDEEALEQHLSVNRPKRKPRRKKGQPLTREDLTCHMCHKVYKNPNSLRDHMKLHNKRSREYTCEKCGKMFYNKGTLTGHIMSHEQMHRHVCKICNKSFLFPNMLRRHVEIHSGVKPYPCEHCGKRFRLRYQLKAHAIVHTDAKPYVCAYCSKAFRFKQILKNHERQHTGAKPYGCQMCGIEFTNWSNYNKHMKRRHGTDTSKKKITPEGVFPVNPDTGMIITVPDSIETEEWKNEIMMPTKRGNKKKLKQDGSTKKAVS